MIHLLIYSAWNRHCLMKTDTYLVVPLLIYSSVTHYAINEDSTNLMDEYSEEVNVSAMDLEISFAGEEISFILLILSCFYSFLYLQYLFS